MTSSLLRSSTNCRLAATRHLGRVFVRGYEHLEKERMRDSGRRRQARLRGYLPPPREKHCPPKPDDGLCECCGGRTKRFHLDHCHKTGAFRGWVCNACNNGHGIMDNVERLEKRIAFLEAHKKRERIALIKATHQISIKR